MTTATDFPDFTQPVGFQEQTDTLAPVGTLLTPNVGALNLDTSAVASVLVAIQPPATAAGSRYALLAAWLQGTFPEEYATLTCHSPATYGTAPNIFYWQLPVRGPQLSLSLHGVGGANASVRVVGSTRVIPDELLVSDVTSNGRYLFTAAAAAIPAGTDSATFYVPPVASRIKLRGSFSLALTTVRVNGLYWDGGAVQVAPLAWLTPTAGVSLEAELDVPRIGLELVLHNGDAAAHSMTADLWDVS